MVSPIFSGIYLDISPVVVPLSIIKISPGEIRDTANFPIRFFSAEYLALSSESLYSCSILLILSRRLLLFMKFKSLRIVISDTLRMPARFLTDRFGCSFSSPTISFRRRSFLFMLYFPHLLDFPYYTKREKKCKVMCIVVCTVPNGWHFGSAH